MNKEELIKGANDRLIEQGNLDAVDKFFTANYVAHSGDQDHKGQAFVRRFASQIRLAIPDISILKIEFFVKADNVVAWQRTLQGSHQSELMGIPPSGKKIRWQEMVISRFEGDKIAEEWVVSELAGQLLLKQAPPL